MSLSSLDICDMVPAYIAQNYPNKIVTLDYQDYESSVDIKEFTSDLELAIYALNHRTEIWENAKQVVDNKVAGNLSSHAKRDIFVREVFNFFVNSGKEEICYKIVRNKLVEDLPLDLIEKYS